MLLRQEGPGGQAGRQAVDWWAGQTEDRRTLPTNCMYLPDTTSVYASDLPFLPCLCVRDRHSARLHDMCAGILLILY